MLEITTRTGKPISYSSWRSRKWRQVVEAADVGEIRPHDLRHNYASALLRSGTDVVTVSHLMGHETPDITLRIYSHMIPGAETEATGRLDSFFGSA